MTHGKEISKFLCMKWTTYLYRIAKAQQNSIAPPTVSEVRICVFKPQKEEDTCRLRYSPSNLTALKCLRLPLKTTEASYQYNSVFHWWREAYQLEVPLKKKEIKYHQKKYQASATQSLAFSVQISVQPT